MTTLEQLATTDHLALRTLIQTKRHTASVAARRPGADWGRKGTSWGKEGTFHKNR
ncbi:multiple cyclophane-containing RiPP AmcA [Amycolatopsis sp. NPDC059657]|uniref:multiple cyclophane-containing RiPP AmcA n=1 Tax=Amycolatopsis sp. NPDC059657 TaxID=3346899 RepID=UPI00366E4A51